MIDIEWIRGKEESFPNKGALHLAQGVRGAMIGRLELAIAQAAQSIGLPITDGREIRLALATQVFGRNIRTFNELTDAEVWALDQWVLQCQAAGLEDWLRQQCGSQISLPAVSAAEGER